MTWHDAANLAGPVLALIGVLLAPELGRRAGRKTVDAVLKQAEAAQGQAEAAKEEAEAAKEEAAAEMRKAVAAEREAASADWARFVDAQDRQIARLTDDVADNQKRIADAEMRSAASDLRASKAENLYSVAIIYLHSVYDWASQQLPGVRPPPPPPEIASDLRVHRISFGRRGRHHQGDTER